MTAEEKNTLGRPGDTARLADLPVLNTKDFRSRILDRVKQGARICSYSGMPSYGAGTKILAILAHDETGTLEAFTTGMPKAFDSLTPDCPQAHLFERELHEQWGMMPTGHPWLKPMRFPLDSRGNFENKSVAGMMDFFAMQGEQIHEVAVGPVHAGIIEPGHFRFQCHGETVYHLEISLGYQHRGVEQALTGGPNLRTPHYFETLAGDSTIGHTTAGCSVIEALSNIKVPPRGRMIRGIAAELERMANHIGDLGAIAGDVGFLPTMSYCGRIRGDVLNLTALICGNRFGRGLVIPGGTFWDIPMDLIPMIQKRLNHIEKDATGAMDLMFKTPSVLARLEYTGKVEREIAENIGLVGPAARASGLFRDVRISHPCGIYRTCPVNVMVETFGDCFARAHVRWREVQESLGLIRTWLESLPPGPVSQPWEGTLCPGRITTVLTEGWRGEICHTGATDSRGKFLFYKIVDPSFHNWFGLSMALRNQQISDFPLCNKSFNLSYCGHDL